MTMQEFVAEGRRRYTKFSPELAAELCEAISCGVSLHEYCATPGRPSRRSVVRWKQESPEFSKALTEARIFRAESRSDVIDSILTDVQVGRLDPISGRMLVDGHKWLMAKENGRYSDTQKVELSGPGGASISILNADQPEMKEIARFYSLIISKGEEAARLLELQPGEFEELPAHGESK